MKAASPFTLPRARLGLLLGAVLAAAFCMPTPARAQIALLVNGDPITAFDIEQRGKLLKLSTHKQPPREDIVKELIDEKLKVQVGKKYGLDISPSDVESAYGNIARRMRVTPEQFSKSLESQGVNPVTLKARLRADLAWGQIIRGKFATQLQVGEKDVVDALGTRKTEGEDVGYDFTLRPILFVVPRGSADTVVEARKREAEALRGRFQSCDDGIAFARNLRDVVVRDPVRRNSADLSPQLRIVLDSIAIGKLTTPEVTQGGIELFALCGKERTTAETPGKREARDEIFAKRYEEQAKKFLVELRRGAMIEYKQ